MTIRIDTDTFDVEKTASKGIYRITATVTQDGVEVTEPELHRVSILYNKNAGTAQMLADLEAAIEVPDTPFETAIQSFKDTYTETLVTTNEGEPQSSDIYITTTGTVTVN